MRPAAALVSSFATLYHRYCLTQEHMCHMSVPIITWGHLKVCGKTRSLSLCEWFLLGAYQAACHGVWQWGRGEHHQVCKHPRAGHLWACELGSGFDDEPGNTEFPSLSQCLWARKCMCLCQWDGLGCWSFRVFKSCAIASWVVEIVFSNNRKEDLIIATNHWELWHALYTHCLLKQERNIVLFPCFRQKKMRLRN